MERRTSKKHRTPRGADKRDTPTHNLSRIERDIRAYELTLQGCSVRGICEELNIKSTATAHNAIQRGKAYVIEKGIDVDERRIDIDKLFKETLGILVQTARHQAEHGQEEFYIDQDGRKSMKRRVGIDPRIAGELSRSLNRWAEFCGLLERAPEQNNAITMVNLSAPSDGASFSDKWSQAPADNAIDVTPASEGVSEPKELPKAPDQG
jgi:hypothetical protein